MSTQAAVTCLTIAEFCAALRQLPAAAFDEVGPVEEFLRTHPVSAESLAPYLVWDRQHYTRNLIDKTAHYELLAICWEVGQQSSIHNHHGQLCWMTAPIGRLRVQNYRTDFEDLRAGRCVIFPSNAVEMNATKPCAVDPRQPVHKVVNPPEWGERAVSLHIYSRPFDRCVVYAEEQGTCGEIQLSYTTVYGRKSAADER